jgi:hypothetical protein
MFNGINKMLMTHKIMADEPTNKTITSNSSHEYSVVFNLVLEMTKLHYEIPPE